MSKTTSPFKFLDAYQQKDQTIFFGREQETNALYHALSGVKHLLVYGPSGAGKSSLIECGLRNQFSDADWFALSIRRGSNVVSSVFARINDCLEEKFQLNPDSSLPLDPDLDFGKMIEQLFAERYQPVYLLFDQFEELLLLGTEEEKKDFFTRLNLLIRYRVPCRVLLIMREEFIGHLSEFEVLCPSIFQYRFRLEKMGRQGVKEVIQKTLDAPEYLPYFSIQDSTVLSEAILARLPDTQREIELTHVQVFLNELWERAQALQTKTNAPVPVMHRDLVQIDDDLERVLSSFLRKQLLALSAQYKQNQPMEVLAAMISERHTKLQMSEESIAQDLQAKGIDIPDLGPLLRDLVACRILRTLKSGLNLNYEISHDLLASVVGQNLTEEMKLRERARDVYSVYSEKKGHLSLEDLEYLRPYKAYLVYPEPLQAQIEFSEKHWKEEQLKQEKEQQTRLRQSQLQTRIATGLALFAAVALVFAIVQFFQVKTANNTISNIYLDGKIQTAHTLKVQGKYQEAINMLTDALKIPANFSDARLHKINTLKNKWRQLAMLKQTGLSKIKLLNYSDAIQDFQTMYKIDPDETINTLIQSTKKEQEVAFEKAIQEGFGMIISGRKEKARMAYEKALRIKPGHPEVIEKLKQFKDR
ncbi:MAG: ATP-binding protein [Haliscomenobacter sp.]|uniref:ATP-binding protein n=1 Tax=Haliscomenobacter sp. TaxID=2717303 RepID=UPI0029BD8190|nr:ATP-binding protein [Haliscomenobacter sp.]MDX2067167.1 ATP-binding protein [Haliscomenobacter sp.]